MKYLKYSWYVAKHKWYVFLECCKIGEYWIGIIHDWSKFRPSEFFPYAEHFYGRGKDIATGRDETGYYKPTDTGDAAFDFAWFLHVKCNKHHWQYWVLPTEVGVKVLEIPPRYFNEMVADWHGASKAQGRGGEIFDWWQANNHKLQLHLFTRQVLNAYIENHGRR